MQKQITEDKILLVYTDKEIKLPVILYKLEY